MLVDQEAAGLWRTVRLAAALYTLTSCVQGVTRWLSELVAARHALQLGSDHWDFAVLPVARVATMGQDPA